MALRREHETKALRRDVNYLERECMSDFYARQTQGTYIVDLQQRSRELEAKADLNAVRVAGVEAREVPGWGAKEKAMAFELTNKNSEEIEDLQRRVATLERAKGGQSSE